MRTLRRKLWRDLWALKGQAATIAVVIAAGVMTLILSVTSLDAVTQAKERFYSESRFADVFASLNRAPLHQVERIRAIDGVNLVEPRVKAGIRVQVPGYDDPVRGQLISLPEGREPLLNRLYIREGRLPSSGRGDEVAISEPFSEAHNLRAGDRFTALIRGRQQVLTVTGVVLSPEFIYQIGPADLLPDYERFGVFWMNERALASAYDMEGAFNSLLVSLQAGASSEAVIEAMDELLSPYGGVGAHDRMEQMSHRFLSDELDQLRVMAVVLPVIFLGVAAFLLNVLMGRTINTQRQQVAVLKAFGYGNSHIGLHYAMLTGVIVLLGSLLGILLGAWAADALARLYMEYFRFPDMGARLQPRVVLLGVLVAGGAAGLGTFRAVSRAVRLPPAEAMRPPAPETFRRGWLERTLPSGLLGQPGRIILRNLTRHRFKAVFSVTGIALSVSLLLVGSYQFNAVDQLLDTQYRLVQKMDLSLHFTDPVSDHGLRGLETQPGVLYAEPFRTVPVRLRHGRQDYRTLIEGLESPPRLRGLIDRSHRDVELPPEGLLLTDYLARHLDVSPGDEVTAEIMEGQRRTLTVPLAGTVSEPVGVSAYMDRRALNRLLREGPVMSGAWLQVSPGAERALYERLWDVPGVAGIGLVSDAADGLREYIEGTMLVMMGILLLLAAAITIAVVYNNARIAFAERSRELATLRVLGFSRREVAWILIGEMVLLVLVAIPVGWLLGTGLALLLNEAISTDMFRIPFVITVQTYALAAVGVLVAAAVSLLLIGRQLHRLDMLSALKTAE